MSEVATCILSFFLLRRAALRRWKQKNGQAATYNNLIIAFENAQRQDFAETVKKVLYGGEFLINIHRSLFCAKSIASCSIQFYPR